ncbi:MAG: hypothetical protein BVN35_17555 [Proteobacteria bacterium ST_bin11]|nr:MAG: hypothetical protein BVN35_17555 [Proteobacteria bacterium ST_bin11]
MSAETEETLFELQGDGFLRKLNDELKGLNKHLHQCVFRSSESNDSELSLNTQGEEEDLKNTFYKRAFEERGFLFTPVQCKCRIGAGDSYDLFKVAPAKLKSKGLSSCRPRKSSCSGLCSQFPRKLTSSEIAELKDSGDNTTDEVVEMFEDWLHVQNPYPEREVEESLLSFYRRKAAISIAFERFTEELKTQFQACVESQQPPTLVEEASTVTQSKLHRDEIQRKSAHCGVKSTRESESTEYAIHMANIILDELSVDTTDTALEKLYEELRRDLNSTLSHQDIDQRVQRRLRSLAEKQLHRAGNCVHDVASSAQQDQ